MSCAPLQTEAGNPAGFWPAVEDSVIASSPKRLCGGARRILPRHRGPQSRGSLWGSHDPPPENHPWSEDHRAYFGFESGRGSNRHTKKTHTPALPAELDRIFEVVDRAVRNGYLAVLVFRSTLRTARRYGPRSSILSITRLR